MQGVLSTIVFVYFLLLSPLTGAYEIVGPYFIPKTRVERHFDANANGTLDAIERAYLKTHEKYRWELATTKRQKLYDHNGDHMLSPPEWDQYLRERKERKRIIKR